MSHEDFKKIVDSARQILVGKLPNPQDQIDAITYAMMYKFMNDIDDKAAALPGGKRKHFADEFEKYSWHNLMRADGQDQLLLYREAIEKMSKNPGLPALFREIYSGAMLKFNDPRTLRLFLKEIDQLAHGTGDHIGDAYEYLLSLMSSQGGLGQFRTPRHIIKFIVEAVNPGKDDKIMDPAAGTAGFLIAAYEHILHQHDGVDEHGNKNEEKRLSSAELDKIHENFRGFDIDATMIRTGRVNLYLHGFKTPDIIEHDTLTSEDYWSDRYDVILANPPFMTPKGGIQPHKKFGVSANRAEVLFVDYIASHLKPRGRAGIIVPEGIIFQGGTAYKQLRKNLVESQGLYAVVSLPSGVFNPYAGVKTSILLLDSELAKERNDILFIKVENDGFSLSAQRRAIAQNDLPEALEIIEQYKTTGKIPDSTVSAQLVPKATITENPDYNLSGDRYVLGEVFNTNYDLVRLGDVAEILNGFAFKSSSYVDEGMRVIRITNVQKGKIVDNDPKYYPLATEEELKRYVLEENDLLLSLTGNVGRVGLLPKELLPAGLNQRVACIRPGDKILKGYLFAVLNQNKFEQDCINSASGMAQKNMSTVWLANYEIPLPPLAVQEKIVAEIENKQRAIDSAREVIASLERERDDILTHALSPQNTTGQL